MRSFYASRDNYDKIPAAVTAVLHNFYMDDFLSSIDTNEGLNVSKELD